MSVCLSLSVALALEACILRLREVLGPRFFLQFHYQARKGLISYLRNLLLHFVVTANSPQMEGLDLKPAVCEHTQEYAFSEVLGPKVMAAGYVCFVSYVLLTSLLNQQT